MQGNDRQAIGMAAFLPVELMNAADGQTAGSARIQ
jgi:hypothetical protein